MNANAKGHRHRVKMRAWGVHAAAAVAVLMGAAWLLLQGVVCWNPRATEATTMWCDWAFILPDLAVIIAAGVAGTMVASIWHLGTETAPPTRQTGLRLHMHRTRAGYHALADTQVHVRRSVMSLSMCLSLFVGVSLFSFFYIEVPYVIVGALVLAGALFWGARALVHQSPSGAT